MYAIFGFPTSRHFKVKHFTGKGAEEKCNVWLQRQQSALWGKHPKDYPLPTMVLSDMVAKEKFGKSNLKSAESD